MAEFSRILYPVDLSEISHKIVPYVVVLASRFNAQVHLLFVIRSLEHFANFYIPNPALNELQQDLTKGARLKLEEFAAEYFKVYPPSVVTTSLGDPAEEIMKYAAAEQIDLIVMGTHGRKGLEKIIFGSVANQVVKNSPVPVMTINPYLSPGWDLPDSAGLE